MNMLRYFFLFAVSALLSACATGRDSSGSCGVSLASKVALETLSSTVTVSLRTADRHISGRGVMLYRRPDHLRLIILSPFGTTVMDTLVAGDNITIVYPATGVAYQGRIADLPAAAGQRGFAMLRWVLDSEPQSGSPLDGIIERTSVNGGMEHITIRDGLLVEKSLKSGELVSYRKHKNLSNVCLPMELQMETADGDRVKLNLEEPEANTELELAAFTIQMQGLRLFPLSELKAQ